MNKRDMITSLQAKRAELSTGLDTILSTVQNEKRTKFTEDERTSFDSAEADIKELDARVKELDDQIRADEASAEMNKRYASAGTEVREAPVYQRGTDQSFFRDLYKARQNGDRGAMDRLDRNNKMVAETKRKEGRALSTTDGAGGEFVPPLWLMDEIVRLSRPGRVTANLVKHGEVPPGTDSINIPKVTGGTLTGPQASGAQNATYPMQDMTTGSVSSPVDTIAGGQVLSLQVIEQSPLNVDELVLDDLAQSYAQQLNTQVLTGSGTGGKVTGLLTLSGTNAVTWTTDTPTVGGAGGLYGALANAIQQIHTARFMPPTHIIMSPRRWAWIEAQSDTTGRPLVVPASGNPQNASGTIDGVVSEGMVGTMLGLPVFVDALIPTNTGAGSDQDSIIVTRASDLWLWEGTLRAEAFAATYADKMSVLTRIYNYVSFQAGRLPASTSVISGTGLVAPAF